MYFRQAGLSTKVGTTLLPDHLETICVATRLHCVCFMRSSASLGRCVGVDIHCSIATELKEATAVHTCGPGERAILAIWLARAVSIASAVA